MPVGASAPAFLLIAMKRKQICKYFSFSAFLIHLLTHSLQFIALLERICIANWLAPGMREHIHVRTVYEKSVFSFRNSSHLAWATNIWKYTLLACPLLRKAKISAVNTTLTRTQWGQGSRGLDCICICCIQLYLHFFFIFKASSENVSMCILIAS